MPGKDSVQHPLLRKVETRIGLKLDVSDAKS
jgi:hypothetical protein